MFCQLPVQTCYASVPCNNELVLPELLPAPSQCSLTYLRNHLKSQLPGDGDGRFRVRGPDNSHDRLATGGTVASFVAVSLLREVCCGSQSSADIRAGVQDPVAQSNVDLSQQRRFVHDFYGIYHSKRPHKASFLKPA